MRRFLMLILVCLLPLQISWAAVVDYCGHAQDRTAQHLGHHDDTHEAASGTSGDSTHPGQYDLGHNHCHLSSFLGILSAHMFAMGDSLQSSLPVASLPHYPSLAPDKPERPKWSVPA